MTYPDKINSARAILESHNQNVTSENKKIDVESFFAKLEELGGTSEEALRDCTWEDLQDAGLPRIMARQIANQVFRKDTTKKVHHKKDDVYSWDYETLLRNYVPREPKSHVSKRLIDLSDNQPFIVFNKDGSVNIEVSQKLLHELNEGLPARTRYELDGKLVDVRRVGEYPGKFFEQNPLFPDEFLRPDGTCDRTLESWDGVDLQVRQLMFLAVESGEFEVDRVPDALNLIEMAKEKDMSYIRKRCPEASSQYDDLEELNQLPSLKMKVGSASGKKNDPFFSKSSHKSW